MRKLVAGILVVVASAGLGGCSRSKGEVLTAKPGDPALSGKFYATAGPADVQADLFNLRFAPGLVMFAMTTGHRTFGVDGCPASLTVGVAGADVNFQDALRRFDGETRVIDGLGDGAGALATVAPDCRMVFLKLDRSMNPPAHHLMLFDPGAKNLREVYAPGSGKVLGVSDWGPDGRVAVFEGTQPTEGHPTVPTGIVVINVDGSKKLIPPPVASFGTLQWGASKWMAVSDETNAKTVFLDPDSGTRSELMGWIPLSWSPDGQRLMVTDAAERKTLAVVDSANLSTARVVGHAKKVSFIDLVWLPFDATAGGPLPMGRRPDDGDGG